MENRVTRLCEAVHDVTIAASYLALAGQITLPEDSRELFQACLGIAEEFERGWYEGSDTVPFTDDYIGDIDLFADGRLREMYGTPDWPDRLGKGETVYTVSFRPTEVTGVYDNLDIYEGELYQTVGVYRTEAKAREVQERLLNQPTDIVGELDVVVEEWEVK